MNIDLNFLVALPIERLTGNRETIVRESTTAWQLFLAEARKRFLVDELLAKNGLATKQLTGEILEVDSGSSLLSHRLRRSNIRSTTTDLYHPKSPSESIYGLGVSHNQLEHLPTLSAADATMEFLSGHSKYGMVHQVHAVDDPAFEWDGSHSLRMTSKQWEEYFKQWVNQHQEEGWTYLGNHRGAPGRPRNFVLERNGSFPFYKHYDLQTSRKIIAELTVANGISISRIPLLLTSLAVARNNPYLLAGLIGVVHTLDALDGYAARSLGSSPFGPHADIEIDHIIQLIISYHYAYDRDYIPKPAFWILNARNLTTDLLRLYNAFKVGIGKEGSDPHKAFGTEDKLGRLTYGLIKAVGDMTIPIIPEAGLEITAVQIGTSLARAIPVWTSPTSRQIYRELLEAILSKSAPI